MIKDEDVIKSTTGQYMKPHERVIYTIALIIGVLLIIAGIVILFVSELLTLGIILSVVGVFEVAGVGVLLWTDGEKKKKEKNDVSSNNAIR